MVEEVKREVVIRRVVAGKLSVSEAASLLGLSERQVWRLRARYVNAGAPALVHGNRGRARANKIDDALRDKIGPPHTHHAGAAQTHHRGPGLTESLAALLTESLAVNSTHAVVIPRIARPAVNSAARPSAID